MKCFYLFFNLYFNSIVDLLLHINFLLHNPRLANILLSDKCYHILESHLTLEFFDELMVRFQSGAQMLSLQTKLKSSPSTAMLDSWYELFCQMWHCATHVYENVYDRKGFVLSLAFTLSTLTEACRV